MNLPLTTMSGTYHNACYDASTPAVGSVEINVTPIVIALNDGQNDHFKCSYNRIHHCNLRICPLALKVLFSIFAALYLPYLFLSSLLITAYKKKKISVHYLTQLTCTKKIVQKIIQIMEHAPCLQKDQCSV